MTIQKFQRLIVSVCTYMFVSFRVRCIHVYLLRCVLLPSRRFDTPFYSLSLACVAVDSFYLCYTVWPLRCLAYSSVIWADAVGPYICGSNFSVYLVFPRFRKSRASFYMQFWRVKSPAWLWYSVLLACVCWWPRSFCVLFQSDVAFLECRLHFLNKWDVFTYHIRFS